MVGKNDRNSNEEEPPTAARYHGKRRNATTIISNFGYRKNWRTDDADSTSNGLLKQIIFLTKI